MQIVRTIDEVRAARWDDTWLTWGLVPTMGALHDGHLSLVRQARAENDRVAVSIFVNPIQFNQQADLDKYPRDLDRDAELLADHGVDLIWAPDEAIMYPPGFQTYIELEDVTRPLEGAARPGHFKGVATVVAKLFNALQPNHAYFGQKDAQQVAVIQQMVRDLAFNLQIVVCPILREADGLAMSSRNALLKPTERAAATVLYRALLAAVEAWEAGQRNGDALRAIMQNVIAMEPLAAIDYASAADPVTLQEIAGEADAALLSMAVFVGTTRLIDNMVLGDPQP